MDSVMLAAMGILLLIGILMIVAPDQCLRADKRGDKEFAAKVRKCGYGIVGLMAAVALLSFKYTMF